MSDGAAFGVVVIGRNEGERLVRCLQSLSQSRAPLVYVDSSSTDGSCEQAQRLGAHLAWTRLGCGSEILVPLDDYVGRAAYFVGDLDRKISALIQRIVRSGDQVIDVGANLGVVTLHLA